MGEEINDPFGVESNSKTILGLTFQKTIHSKVTVMPNCFLVSQGICFSEET